MLIRPASALTCMMLCGSEASKRRKAAELVDMLR